MSRNAFNESEVFLMKNWSAACRLEDAMNTIRKERYAALLDEAARMIVDRLGKDSYVYEVYAYQNWDDGFIMYWMKEWESSNDKGECPVFGIGGLRLEHLFAEDGSSDQSSVPYAYLYTKGLRKIGCDLENFRVELEKAAAKILQEFPKRSEEDENIPVCYNLPEGRSELKRLLLDDVSSFLNVLVEHGVRLADLAPIVTKVFLKGK